MTVSVICLTHNRLPYLKDFVASHLENSRRDTELVICAQGCTDGTVRWLTQTGFVPTMIRHTKIIIETDNIGLDRYDELVETYTSGICDIIVDTDDDSLLPKGYEEAFETVLFDERFGWVGIPPGGNPLLRFPNGREWNVNGYRVVEAAVGGGLAATRKDVWEEIGGFGVGRTIFDPEDARYQRKCLASGYLTGMIVGEIGVTENLCVEITDKLSYEHHGSWEWAIKYGCAQEKLEDKRLAMQAGFLTEEQFRLSWQAYLDAMENV